MLKLILFGQMRVWSAWGKSFAEAFGHFISSDRSNIPNENAIIVA